MRGTLMALALLLSAVRVEGAPVVPGARERLAPLRWLLGSWRCDGKMGDRPWSFELDFTESLQGAWLDGHMSMSTPGGSFELVGTLGYSTKDGRWVRWDRSSTGSTKLLASDGPEDGGGAITFASAPEEGGFRERLARSKQGIAGRIEGFEKGRWSEAASFACRPAR